MATFPMNLDDSIPHASASNSSTTPLGSSATFTGTGDRDDLPDVAVSCTTDAAGTLFFEFSNDDITYSPFPVNGFTVAAGIHEFHTAVKMGRWFRVRLVNDTTAQTSLNLVTYFGTYAKQPNAPLNQSIGSDSDATLVRSVLVGEDLEEPGTFINVPVNKSGGLVMANFEWLVSRGSAAGFEMIRRTGLTQTLSSNATASQFQDVWNGTGVYTGQPTTAAETINFKSSSALDTSAGTGARTFRAHGLTSAGLQVTHDLSFNGTTNVPSPASMTRCNFIEVLTAGSTGSNAGTITATGATSAALYVTFPARANQSRIAAYTIPTGKTGMLIDADTTLVRTNGSAGSATGSIRTRKPGGVYVQARPFVVSNSLGTTSLRAAIPLEAGEDVVSRVNLISDSNSQVMSELTILLIDG